MAEGGALPRVMNPTVSLPPAVDAYTRRYTQNAVNNRTFTPSETVIIQIPTGRPGAFLVPQLSYLRFSVTFTGTAAAAAGNRNKFSGLAGAANVIGEQRVLLNGSVVEEILNHQVCYELFHDAGCGVRQNFEETMSGAYPVVLTAGGDNEDAPIALYASNSNCSAAGAVAVAADVVRTFCVPIMSALLGTFAEKALPTCLIAPNSLELHLRLSEVTRAINISTSAGGAGAVASGGYTVGNVQFVGCEVVLPSAVMDSIISMVPQGLEIYSSTVHNYTAATGANATPNIVLGTNYASVNSLFLTFPADASAQRPANRRMKPTAAETTTVTCQLQIGSERVPQVPTSGDAQIMAELMQAFGALADKDAAPSAVFSANAFTVRTANAPTMVSSFAIGYDLDVFSIASDQVRSGRNLVGQQTTVSLTGLDGINHTVQSYVWHDVKYVFRAGGAVTAYW